MLGSKSKAGVLLIGAASLASCSHLGTRPPPPLAPPPIPAECRVPPVEPEIAPPPTLTGQRLQDAERIALHMVGKRDNYRAAYETNRATQAACVTGLEGQ